MKNATAEQRKRLALPRYWSMCNQFFPLICMIWLWLLFGKHTITLFYVENWSDLMHVSFVMHCTHWFGIYSLFFHLLLELVPTTPRLRNTRFVYFEHYERMKVCQWKKIAWEQETLLYCEWARFSAREMIESIQSLRFRLFFFHLICAL